MEAKQFELMAAREMEQQAQCQPLTPFKSPFRATLRLMLGYVWNSDGCLAWLHGNLTYLALRGHFK